MGFNTSVTILNDGVDQILEHPGEFADKLVEHLPRGGVFGVGNHANVVTVHKSAHANVTQLVAVGGNYSTVVHTAYGAGPHHTGAGQLAVLRSWADAMGYRLEKKEA